MFYCHIIGCLYNCINVQSFLIRESDCCIYYNSFNSAQNLSSAFNKSPQTSELTPGSGAKGSTGLCPGAILGTNYKTMAFPNKLLDECLCIFLYDLNPSPITHITGTCTNDMRKKNKTEKINVHVCTRIHCSYIQRGIFPSH